MTKYTREQVKAALEAIAQVAKAAPRASDGRASLLWGAAYHVIDLLAQIDALQTENSMLRHYNNCMMATCHHDYKAGVCHLCGQARG